ncbi:MAG: hypothetical protein FJ308_17570 [Planctomycetes bacterium]|nr:hypothetical protein [Planctomycetota bacterium]
MTESPDFSYQEPPWHFLPRFPRKFFGIGPEATREQLKHAYSVLIRKYKPERYPEEFKRIRAAFEQVDREMRKSTSKDLEASDEPLNDDELWFTYPVFSANVNGHSSGTSGSFEKQQASVSQRLEVNDPEAWYAEVSGKAIKLPDDYYTLAVLSQVLSTPAKGFIDWIVEGTMCYPQNQPLRELLEALFERVVVTADEAAGMLLRLAVSIPSSSYYLLTEPLWQRFALLESWDKVQPVLASVERCLEGKEKRYRTAFMICLMRRVMWRAPLEWLQEQREWIEEGRDPIPSHLEIDHEINCKVIALRDRCVERLQNGPHGRRILECIRSYCEEGEWEAVTKICDCQFDIATHPHEFLKEFEFRPEEDTQWSHGWQLICWLVQGRISTQGKVSNSRFEMESLAEMMKNINKRFPRGVELNIALRNIAALSLFLMGSVLFLIFGIAISTMLSTQIFGLTSAASYLIPVTVMIAGMVTILWSLWPLGARWSAWALVPYIKRRTNQEYKASWRFHVARSMQFFLCPYFHYVETVQQVTRARRFERSPSSWLPIFMANDLGLMLYCAAVPFSR